MFSSRVWILLNISLGVAALFLILTFFGVSVPSVGKVQYWMDQEEPLCVVNWQEDYAPLDEINRCCLEAAQQLTCLRKPKELSAGRVDWVCQSGPGVVGYWLNNKAYHYCQQQVFWR